jgi:hypothetical protein
LGPTVKKVRRWSSFVAGGDDAGEAGLLQAQLGEEFAAVLGGIVAISASIAAETTTASAPSALAFSNTAAE